MTQYIVKSGDSLSTIAAAQWGDYTKWPLIQKANSITDPNKIYPGQVLIIPDVSNGAVAATQSNVATTTKQTTTTDATPPKTSTGINKLWYWAGGGVLAAAIAAAIFSKKKKKKAATK